MRSSELLARPVRLPRHWAGIAMIILLSGCSTMQPPKPWEKGRLADHIYTSKEAGSGGRGVGGGGCGCN
jgi:hypothetical protein